MPLNPIFSFTSNTEGLADDGLSSILTFAHESGDGSPGSGCAKWTASADSSSQTETATDTRGYTWEDYGVPAGATVTSVRLVGYNSRLVTAGAFSWSHTVRIVVAGNSHDLDTVGGVSIPYAWRSEGAGATITLTSGETASDATVDLRFYLTVGSHPGSTFDFRLDQVELEITYEESGGPVDDRNGIPGNPEHSVVWGPRPAVQEQSTVPIRHVLTTNEQSVVPIHPTAGRPESSQIPIRPTPARVEFAFAPNPAWGRQEYSIVPIRPTPGRTEHVHIQPPPPGVNEQATVPIHPTPAVAEHSRIPIRPTPSRAEQAILSGPPLGNPEHAAVPIIPTPARVEHPYLSGPPTGSSDQSIVPIHPRSGQTEHTILSGPPTGRNEQGITPIRPTPSRNEGAILSGPPTGRTEQSIVPCDTIPGTSDYGTHSWTNHTHASLLVIAVTPTVSIRLVVSADPAVVNVAAQVPTGIVGSSITVDPAIVTLSVQDVPAHGDQLTVLVDPAYCYLTHYPVYGKATIYAAVDPATILFESIRPTAYTTGLLSVRVPHATILFTSASGQTSGWKQLPDGTGNIKYGFCRDAQGVVWTEEVSITDGDHAGVGCFVWGSRHHVLFTRGGDVWQASSMNPENWTSATIASTGLHGEVLDCCVNNKNVVLALIEGTIYRSRDGGENWEACPTQPTTSPSSLTTIGSHFVALSWRTSTLLHFVSLDDGDTWL